MAITVAQLPAALLTIADLQAKLNDMHLLLAQAKELSDKNWQTDIGSRFSLVLTVSPAQQAAMVGAYDAMKTSLVSIFQQLP